ncbi:MAG: Ig-like domain-containing protein [Armatimonadota bacterium]
MVAKRAVALRRWGVILVLGAKCGAARAGTLTVTVTNGGAPVNGAVVRVEVDGPNGTTNADGKWSATVAAGSYRVMAWKTIAGALRGAIADLTMPAGNATVSLRLTDAVWTYNLFPYAVGNAWQYKHLHVGPDGRETSTWRERVDRTEVVNGEPAVVLVATKDMVPEWEEIRASTRNGFVVFTQQHGADTIKFDPPMRLGALLPLSYEWAATTTAHHSDGSRDTHLEIVCELVGFDNVVVPAGPLRGCAHFEIGMSLGAENSELDVWTARNVGIVRQIKRTPGCMETKMLEAYSLRPPLLPREVGPIIRRP